MKGLMFGPLRIVPRLQTHKIKTQEPSYMPRCANRPLALVARGSISFYESWSRVIKVLYVYAITHLSKVVPCESRLFLPSFVVRVLIEMFPLVKYQQAYMPTTENLSSASASNIMPFYSTQLWKI
jgi:hypothetical protein